MNRSVDNLMHDILDNRNHPLRHQVEKFLDVSERGRFAIGDLFLAGLVPYVKQLATLEDVRILAANSVHRESVDQMAYGRHKTSRVLEMAEAARFPKRPEVRRMEIEFADEIRASLCHLDQTDENERAIHALIEVIESGNFHVRLHTKGRLNARACIFDFAPSVDRSQEPGIGIVGSTNLLLSEVSQTAELNTIVRGGENHRELVEWFDDHWKKSRDVSEKLLGELQNCWASTHLRPYDIYMKSLYTLVCDHLEDNETTDLLWDDDITENLADFQRVAVEQAIQIIRNYGGVFVSDVVGLGKSFIGAAIVKHFERMYHCRPLIICPAPLVDMWERYNEVYGLNARVTSMGLLRDGQIEDANPLLDNELYQYRDFVLVDESHNFRHSNTQRYRILQEFLEDGKRCCFLTATPRNKSAWDVYTQMKLFHQEEKTDLPVNPPHLHEFFKGVEQGSHRLQELLSNILIRRTRRDIIKWYGYDAQTDQRVNPAEFEPYRDGQRKAYIIVAGRKQFFPTRRLETIEYSIDDAYQGLYQQVRHILGATASNHEDSFEFEELTYARYGLWNYLRPEMREDDRYTTLQKAGANLRGLMRVLLFKRFESSVHAFRETVARLITNQTRFEMALQEGIIPAGHDAQDLLNDPGDPDELELLDALQAVSGKYASEDFDMPRLLRDLSYDILLLNRIQEIVSPITPEKDTKLQRLLDKLRSTPLNQGKCLIFTQYADTANYLGENLIAATGRSDIDVVSGNDRSRLSKIGRFAPVANPEYRKKSTAPVLNILVATDSLSEGLNLQDSDKIINYDLHWNPVRLIQRFGRIDRIGGSHEEIHGFNFLPETGIDQHLGLRQKLANRIREIHETIGEDTAILDPAEQLNENAMYAIYEQSGSAFERIEENEEQTFDLNETMELFRQLKQEDPEEFDRIANMPNGVRSGLPSPHNGVFVHLKAERFQKLYLTDARGQIVTQDVPEVLSQIRCSEETEAVSLRGDHNSIVSAIQEQFRKEVEQRQTERRHLKSMSLGQKYVLHGLRELFSAAEDEEKKARISMLERVLRASPTIAVHRELNRIRKNQLVGESLYSKLRELYTSHALRDSSSDALAGEAAQDTAYLVCSESLRME